jgi:hypothetical protein
VELDSNIKRVDISKDEDFAVVLTEKDKLKCFQITPEAGVMYWFNLAEIKDFQFCYLQGQACLVLLNLDGSLIVSRLKDQKLLHSSKTVNFEYIGSFNEHNISFISKRYTVGLFNFETFSIVSEIDLIPPRPENSGKYHPEVFLFKGNTCEEYNTQWKPLFEANSMCKDVVKVNE